MRRTFLVAVVLLCLAGNVHARGSADQSLAVAVDGPGSVAATGVDCRDADGDCVELYADGTTVTLTATPDSGATFAGWGGDCSAATGATCTLTMSSAKAVTATFTAGAGNDSPPPNASPSTVPSQPGSNPPTSAPASMSTLTVSVAGNGQVVGPGINCGGGNTDCSESYTGDRTVFVTALPAPGEAFAVWSGGCSGSSRTCSLVMSASKSVTASFDQASTQPGTTFRVGNSGGATGTGTHASRPTSTFAAHSLGRPLVARTSHGWAVTLRFFTSRTASGMVRLSLNGRPVGAYTFSPRRGNLVVGPFNVTRRGAYRFQLTLTDGRGAAAQLSWNLVV